MDDLPGYCRACLARIEDITVCELSCAKCGKEIETAEDLISEEEMAEMKARDDRELAAARQSGLIL